MKRSRFLALSLVVLALGLGAVAVWAVPPDGFLGIKTNLPNGATAPGVPVLVVPLSGSEPGPIEGETNAYGMLWLSLAPGRYKVYVEGNQHRAPEGEIVSNGEVILWITVVPEEQ